MSTSRDIPGFYFDAEKGKYFRIQPNHKAPAGAAHSQGAVDARKRADIVAEKARLRHDRDVKSVRRFDRGSYANFSLSMRLGARPSKSMINLQKHYAASLCRQSARVEGARQVSSMAISGLGSLCAITRGDSTDWLGIQLIQRTESTWLRRQLWNRPTLFTPGSTHDQLAVFGDQQFAAAIGTLLFRATPIQRIDHANAYLRRRSDDR